MPFIVIRIPAENPLAPSTQIPIARSSVSIYNKSENTADTIAPDTWTVEPLGLSFILSIVCDCPCATDPIPSIIAHAAKSAFVLIMSIVAPFLRMFRDFGLAWLTGPDRPEIPKHLRWSGVSERRTQFPGFATREHTLSFWCLVFRDLRSGPRLFMYDTDVVFAPEIPKRPKVGCFGILTWVAISESPSRRISESGKPRHQFRNRKQDRNPSG